MKTLLIVVLLLCSAVCGAEDWGSSDIVFTDELKIPDPVIYICEKCGRETDYIPVLYSFGKAGESMYCDYCMKEMADKYLPKVIEKK